ncbi:MAG: hypothetical protein OJF55_002145 [Rhodanobacteraceae bacterium]|jgi:hypothetical protein|nr:MAG: hypothetical protein OJF55_002145 [Rhodanobacteraceae bacterium]
MPQRNIQPSIATMSRPATVDGLLPLAGMLLTTLLALVLLITYGGAG